LDKSTTENISFAGLSNNITSINIIQNLSPIY